MYYNYISKRNRLRERHTGQTLSVLLLETYEEYCNRVEFDEEDRRFLLRLKPRTPLRNRTERTAAEKPVTR